MVEKDRPTIQEQNDGHSPFRVFLELRVNSSIISCQSIVIIVTSSSGRITAQEFTR